MRATDRKLARTRAIVEDDAGAGPVVLHGATVGVTGVTALCVTAVAEGGEGDATTEAGETGRGGCADEGRGGRKEDEGEEGATHFEEVVGSKMFNERERSGQKSAQV